MKRKTEHGYPGISSFEELRLERERLILMSKLSESKIKMDIIRLKEAFSIPVLVLGLIRKFVPGKITGLLDTILTDTE